MDEQWVLIEGINPEPWQAPEGAVGRKNGKPFVQMFKPEGVRAYQDAVREELGTRSLQPWSRLCRLDFWFWRQAASWADPGSGRRGKSNVADATNLQKATEDAVQGFLVTNDRLVGQVCSDIVEQGPEVEPRILIRLSIIEPAHRILGITRAAALARPRIDPASNFRDVPDVF